MRLIDADALAQWCEDDLKTDIESEKYNKITEIIGRETIDYLKNAVIPKQPTIGDGDITPEQVIAAYNVMRKYTVSRTASECDNCVFTNICIGFSACPDCWPDLEVPDV